MVNWEKILEEYQRLETKCHGNKASMYASAANSLSLCVENGAENEEELEFYSKLKEVISDNIVEGVLKMNGYFLNKENNMWEKEPGE